MLSESLCTSSHVISEGLSNVVRIPVYVISEGHSNVVRIPVYVTRARTNPRLMDNLRGLAGPDGKWFRVPFVPWCQLRKVRPLDFKIIWYSVMFQT